MAFCIAVYSTDIREWETSRRLILYSSGLASSFMPYLKNPTAMSRKKRKTCHLGRRMSSIKIVSIDLTIGHNHDVPRCWNDECGRVGATPSHRRGERTWTAAFSADQPSRGAARGARKLPPELKGIVTRDIERYEMIGVIDVVTQVELFNPKFRGNRLLELVVEIPTLLPEEFEVIVDYKGMKRPDPTDKGAGLGNLRMANSHLCPFAIPSHYQADHCRSAGLFE